MPLMCILRSRAINTGIGGSDLLLCVFAFIFACSHLSGKILLFVYIVYQIRALIKSSFSSFLGHC